MMILRRLVASHFVQIGPSLFTQLIIISPFLSTDSASVISLGKSFLHFEHFMRFFFFMLVYICRSETLCL